MYVMTDDHKKKIGKAVSNTRSGVPLSDDHKEALRGSHSNRKRVKCEICNKDYAVNTISRHTKVCKGVSPQT